MGTNITSSETATSLCTILYLVLNLSLYQSECKSDLFKEIYVDRAVKRARMTFFWDLLTSSTTLQIFISLGHCSCCYVLLPKSSSADPV